MAEITKEEMYQKILNNPNLNNFISQEEQLQFYNYLFGLGVNPFQHSILENNFGNGAFVGYSLSENIRPQLDYNNSGLQQYVGIDWRQDCVDACNWYYDILENVNFTNKDITEFEDNSFDWSIAVHNFLYLTTEGEDAFERTHSFVLEQVNNLYNVSKLGVVFSMLKNKMDMEGLYVPNRPNLYDNLLSITDNISIADNITDNIYFIILHK